LAGRPQPAMGKAGKKKHAKRFDPLARPEATKMEDDEAEAAPPKQLSAHQQRHFERKRLQAEAEALKNQKRKVSKADKLIWKKESKNIGKTLKANKAALQQAARHGPGLLQQAAESSSAGGSSSSNAPEPPAFGGFNLPAPNKVEVSMF
jgi:hypothetical protein